MIFEMRPFFFQPCVASASASSNSSKTISTTRSSSRCLCGGRWSIPLFIVVTLSRRRLLRTSYCSQCEDMPRVFLTPSVGGVPKQRISVGIVLPRRASKVRIKAPLPELGGFEGERHVAALGHRREAHPSRADLDVVGVDAVVGLHLAPLAAVDANFDRHPDREGAKFADKALLDHAADEADGSHDVSPALAREPVPRRRKAAGAPPGAGAPRGPQRQWRTGEARCAGAAPRQTPQPRVGVAARGR